MNVSQNMQQIIFGLLWRLTFPSRWPKLHFGAEIKFPVQSANPPI
jgi:hypothetical protein